MSAVTTGSVVLQTEIGDTRAARGRPTHRHPGRLRSRGALYVPLLVYGAFTLVPFYWIVVYAFRAPGHSAMVPWPLSLENFGRMWTNLGFDFFLWNSLVVAVATLLCTTIVAVAAGYAVARFQFRGKTAFLISLLCTQFIPGAVLLIPLYLLFAKLGLLNSLVGLALIDTVFQLPLAIILMAGFIHNIPVELEEAAWVDGCSRMRAFLGIILPLLRPGLTVIGAFAFIGAWNNFLFALMFINDASLFTVPVGLSYLVGENSADYGSLAAGGFVAVVPVVVAFAFVQRYLVQGMSAGAIKG